MLSLPAPGSSVAAAVAAASTLHHALAPASFCYNVQLKSSGKKALPHEQPKSLYEYYTFQLKCGAASNLMLLERSVYSQPNKPFEFTFSWGDRMLTAASFESLNRYEASPSGASLLLNGPLREIRDFLGYVQKLRLRLHRGPQELAHAFVDVCTLCPGAQLTERRTERTRHFLVDSHTKNIPVGSGRRRPTVDVAVSLEPADERQLSNARGLFPSSQNPEAEGWLLTNPARAISSSSAPTPTEFSSALAVRQPPALLQSTLSPPSASPPASRDPEAETQSTLAAVLTASRSERDLQRLEVVWRVERAAALSPLLAHATVALELEHAWLSGDDGGEPRLVALGTPGEACAVVGNALSMAVPVPGGCRQLLRRVLDAYPVVVSARPVWNGRAADLRVRASAPVETGLSRLDMRHEDFSDPVLSLWIRVTVSDAAPMQSAALRRVHSPPERDADVPRRDSAATPAPPTPPAPSAPCSLLSEPADYRAPTPPVFIPSSTSPSTPIPIPEVMEMLPPPADVDPSETPQSLTATQREALRRVQDATAAGAVLDQRLATTEREIREVYATYRSILEQRAAEMREATEALRQDVEASRALRRPQRNDQEDGHRASRLRSTHSHGEDARWAQEYSRASIHPRSLQNAGREPVHVHPRTQYSAYESHNGYTRSEPRERVDRCEHHHSGHEERSHHHNSGVGPANEQSQCDRQDEDELMENFISTASRSVRERLGLSTVSRALLRAFKYRWEAVERTLYQRLEHGEYGDGPQVRNLHTRGPLMTRESLRVFSKICRTLFQTMADSLRDASAESIRQEHRSNGRRQAGVHRYDHNARASHFESLANTEETQGRSVDFRFQNSDVHCHYERRHLQSTSHSSEQQGISNHREGKAAQDGVHENGETHCRPTCTEGGNYTYTQRSRQGNDVAASRSKEYNQEYCNQEPQPRIQSSFGNVENRLRGGYNPSYHSDSCSDRTNRGGFSTQGHWKRCRVSSANHCTQQRPEREKAYMSDIMQQRPPSATVSSERVGDIRREALRLSRSLQELLGQSSSPDLSFARNHRLRNDSPNNEYYDDDDRGTRRAESEDEEDSIDLVSRLETIAGHTTRESEATPVDELVLRAIRDRSMALTRVIDGLLSEEAGDDGAGDGIRRAGHRTAAGEGRFASLSRRRRLQEQQDVPRRERPYTTRPPGNV